MAPFPKYFSSKLFLSTTIIIVIVSIVFHYQTITHASMLAFKYYQGKLLVAHIVGVVSQKGGVGKSTIVRLIAREFSQEGWSVKIADLDVSQGTSVEWCRIRQQHDIQPYIRAESFGRVDQALADADRFDLIIVDGAPHATSATLEIARRSDLIVIPTGLSLDDLRPSVLLAHELVQKGVSADRLLFVLTRAGDSSAAIEDARTFVQRAGYRVSAAELPERIGYQRAMDAGFAASETAHRSLNTKAVAVAQGIVDQLTELASHKEVA
ncbi:ParA family protein [Polymorphum gilvum]|uniref:ParA family protein n=1 Tax=Polymorphum gilvum TaxID=991904 RepID=UPI0011D29735|nr:ParA family protein [Polymorphum gilvum]